MIFWFFFTMLFILVLALLYSVFLGVPFVPTHRRQAKLMIELAEIKPGMVVMDLGSGAGRLLFLAARKGAKAIGYELNPLLYLLTKSRIILNGQTKNIQVFCRSLYEADVSGADVVLMFLFPGYMEKIGKKLFSEMPARSKILSYAFSLPGREPIIKKEAIFVYDVGR